LKVEGKRRSKGRDAEKAEKRGGGESFFRKVGRVKREERARRRVSPQRSQRAQRRGEGEGWAG